MKRVEEHEDMARAKGREEMAERTQAGAVEGEEPHRLGPTVPELMREEGTQWAKEPYGDVRIMGVDTSDPAQVKVTMVSENAHSLERSTQAYSVRAEAEPTAPHEAHVLHYGYLEGLLITAAAPKESQRIREGEDPQSFLERENEARRKQAQTMVGKKICMRRMERVDENGQTKRIIAGVAYAGLFGGIKPRSGDMATEEPEKYMKEGIRVGAVRKTEKGFIEVQGRVWAERFSTGERSHAEGSAEGKWTARTWTPKEVAGLLRSCPGAQGRGNGEAEDVAGELERGTIQAAGMRWLEKALKGGQLERVVKIPPNGVEWRSKKDWEKVTGLDAAPPKFTAHNLGGMWVEEPKPWGGLGQAHEAGESAARGGQEPSLPSPGGRKAGGQTPAVTQEQAQAPGSGQGVAR